MREEGSVRALSDLARTVVLRCCWGERRPCLDSVVEPSESGLWKALVHRGPERALEEVARRAAGRDGEGLSLPFGESRENLEGVAVEVELAGEVGK